MLQFMESQRIGYDWVTELNWWSSKIFVGSFLYKIKESFCKRLVKLLWQMVVFGICMTKCSPVWERNSLFNLACNSALIKKFNVWLILEHQSRAYHLWAIQWKASSGKYEKISLGLGENRMSKRLLGDYNDN